MTLVDDRVARVQDVRSRAAEVLVGGCGCRFFAGQTKFVALSNRQYLLALLI